MADQELRRVARDDDAGRLLEKTVMAVNRLTDAVTGDAGTQIRLRGYSGARRNPVGGATLSSNNYPLDAQSPLGLHAAFLLAATAAGAVPSTANAAVLIRDAGLLVGAGKALVLYATAGTNNASLSSDANGGLVLGGTGTSAGALSVTKLIAASIGPSATQQHTLPAVASDTVALLAATQTLSDKTLTASNTNVSGALGTTPLARVTQTGAASAALTLVNGVFSDVPGCSVTLTPGEWVVTGTFFFVEAGAGDVGPGITALGQLVTSGGTATISNSASWAGLRLVTAGLSASCSQTWRVSVTATTTAKLQAEKAGGGTGTSTAGVTHTTITAMYAGNP